MKRSKLFPVLTLFLVGPAACDSLTGNDKGSCPEPITGTYDLVSFEGESLPASFTKTECYFYWGDCSTRSYEILSGELILREDGSFEEIGRSRVIGGSSSDEPLQTTGRYVAKGKSVDFESLFGTGLSRFVGECTKKGLKLRSYATAFHWALLDKTTRVYRKR
jgi:hypothetical protein